MLFVLALSLPAAWWFGPHATATTLAEGPSNTADPLPDQKYAVAPGVYRQANSEDGERLLSIDGPGIGRLVIRLPKLSSLVIGADVVEIDTTWRVDGDDVTFDLHGGAPETAYQRLLLVALEESTRFHIRGWSGDALTLERAADGELFQWERTSDTPLPLPERASADGAPGPT